MGCGKVDTALQTMASPESHAGQQVRRGAALQRARAEAWLFELRVDLGFEFNFFLLTLRELWYKTNGGTFILVFSINFFFVILFLIFFLLRMHIYIYPVMSIEA